MKNEFDDKGRTRIGNTPTCEDCGAPIDNCECDDLPAPNEPVICACGTDLRNIPFIELQNHDSHTFNRGLGAELSPVVGPLRAGHYVQIALGLGFYVPEADYQRAQELANESGKVQFLGVTRDGRALAGTREQVLTSADSAGVCAWVVPNRGGA